MNFSLLLSLACQIIVLSFVDMTKHNKTVRLSSGLLDLQNHQVNNPCHWYSTSNWLTLPFISVCCTHCSPTAGLFSYYWSSLSILCDSDSIEILRDHLLEKIWAELRTVFDMLWDHWLLDAGGASLTGGAVLKKYFTNEQLAELTERTDPNKPTGLDYYPLLCPGERFPVYNPNLEPRLEPRPGAFIIWRHLIRAKVPCTPVMCLLFFVFHNPWSTLSDTLDSLQQ